MLDLITVKRNSYPSSLVIICDFPPVASEIAEYIGQLSSDYQLGKGPDGKTYWNNKSHLMTKPAK